MVASPDAVPGQQAGETPRGRMHLGEAVLALRRDDERVIRPFARRERGREGR